LGSLRQPGRGTPTPTSESEPIEVSSFLIGQNYDI
jgi:hypothetical protein